MKKRISAYWLCQIGGWSAYCLVYLFFYFTIRTKPQPYFYEWVLLDAVTGVMITHLMRLTIRNLNLLEKKLQQQIVSFAIVSVVFAFFFGSIIVTIVHLFNIEPEGVKDYSLLNRTIRMSYIYLLFLLIWNLIYFTYHYVEKSRQQQIDKIRLESLVKELELKTIKSHINPHFIFNALNSIRALVDENPERARTAITELSNLLRSSMQAEKIELTSLEKELNIVKDYLALEHIRFEDRLKVEYDIDEDTLDQHIPPMMLQTLVENAIKHGISRQIDGGIITIISDFKENHHELIVRNSGKLNGNLKGDGFGIPSTQNRLKLLYGKQASFELKDVAGNFVEAKLILPVTIG